MDPGGRGNYFKLKTLIPSPEALNRKSQTLYTLKQQRLPGFVGSTTHTPL